MCPIYVVLTNVSLLQLGTLPQLTGDLEILRHNCNLVESSMTENVPMCQLVEERSTEHSKWGCVDTIYNSLYEGDINGKHNTQKSKRQIK